MERGSAVVGIRTSVAELLAFPSVTEHLTLAAGERGVNRPITHPRIQKSGLVFAGHARGIVPTRVQVLGETEYTFLESRTPEERRRGIEALLSLKPSVVIVTRGVQPFDELVAASAASDTPLVVSTERSSKTIHRVHAALDWLLAPRKIVHGVLLDVHGVGLLLTGPSAVGKSECALFLLERGHRLVADDRVELVRLPTDQVQGSSPELLRNHLELRGIGIVNVRDLFGAAAVRDTKTVNLVVELCQFDELEDYDRLGLDDPRVDLLGLSIPSLRIPVRPGRNMAVILEVAARNHLLKRAGRNAAERFVKRLEEELLSASPGDPEK
jgi:HPr kinase/phosphorylase